MTLLTMLGGRVRAGAGTLPVVYLTRLLVSQVRAEQGALELGPHIAVIVPALFGLAKLPWLLPLHPFRRAGSFRKEVPALAERWVYRRGVPHITAGFLYHRWG